MNKGQLTRQRIIETAAPIFNQRGYSGCSIQDVMAATGLEKGGIYRHFASKETLAVEAFRYSARTTLNARLGDLDEVAGSVEKLLRMVQHFVERPSPIPGGCPLMNAAVDADDGNPALLAGAREAMKTWKTRILRIIDDGIKSSEIRKDIDPRRIANIIIATLEGAHLMSRIEGTRVPSRDAHTALQAVIEGIRR